LPNGALKIVDRKKNIFKLSQGEYIAPEKIENTYLRCKYVAECFLYGDSLQSYNVAVVHPHMDVLIKAAK
jgi:long-chain acyl-CoA synthetase